MKGYKMNRNLNSTEEILEYFEENIKDKILKLPTGTLSNINEIRISSCGTLSVTVRNQNIIIKDKDKQSVKLTKEEIEKIFIKICDGTLYKYENQIRNGYITLKGGHRVGFCGSAVYDSAKLITVKNITSLSFRISRQIYNAAHEIIGNIITGNTIHSALIVSEPCGGKTTMLTDLSRLLSNFGKRVAIIDERGEISAVYNGEPSKDIGELTYVYDGYSKGEGMMNALRSMSPQVIICDEIGTKDDADSMLEALNAGVPVIATAHARCEDELIERPQIERLIDHGAIDKIIFLKGSKSPGSVQKIITVNKYDENNWNSDDID